MSVSRPDRAAVTPTDAPPSPLLALSRLLAHDFNGIWAQIFGLTQQAMDMPGFQSRDEVLGRLNDASASGLLYSRNVMSVLAHTDDTPRVIDACSAVRDWGAENDSTLRDVVTFSCMVPSHPLHVCFPPRALRLILLSLVGYALRRGEEKRWAMLGVRGTTGDGRAKIGEADDVEIMFLCQPSDGQALISYPLQQRVSLIRTLVAAYEGTVEARLIARTGVNVRIRLPLVPDPAR